MLWDLLDAEVVDAAWFYYSKAGIVLSCSGQSESAPSAASDVSGDGKEEVGPQKKSGGTAGAPVKPVKLRLPWRLLLLVGLPGSGKSTFAEVC